MCWKNEWIAARNHLGRANDHIQRARNKLMGRYNRHLATIAKATKKGRSDTIKEAKRLAGKNMQGIMDCDKLIDDLKERRLILQVLINTYGISRKRSP
jgi:hypothetical protein